MRKLGFLLTVGIAAAIASPAGAASEAIKDMARSMHGPDDASHCDDTTAAIEKRIRFCVAAIKDGHFQYNAALADPTAPRRSPLARRDCVESLQLLHGRA